MEYKTFLREHKKDLGQKIDTPQIKFIYICIEKIVDNFKTDKFEKLIECFLQYHRQSEKSLWTSKIFKGRIAKKHRD